MESTKLLQNDPPEVMVLPPNILEKLGIDLGNIQPCSNGTNAKSGTRQPEDISVLDINAPNYVPGKNNDEEFDGSSILETANLMKASVFLSPTFTNLKATNGLNDLEFNNFENAIATIECNVSKPLKSNSPKNNRVVNITLENKSNSSNGVQKNNARGKLQKSNNKINIISEEIIELEKIKDLITSEILVSNNLASVPINTIITEKTINIKNGAASVPSKEKNNNDCKDNNDKPLNDCKAVENKVANINNGIQDQLDKSIQFQIDSDGLKLSKEINLINNTNGDIIMYKNHEEKCSDENQDLVRNCDKDLKITSEQQDEHATSSSEEIVTIIHVINENVDEADVSKDLNFSIPDSVCHFTVTDTIDIVVPEHSELSINYDQENKSCDVKTSADEKILGDRKDAKINNKNLEISTRNKIINVNQNKVKSKLCIQGVEKPGGDDDNVNKDFGYFFYYDKDDDYQHIHYWEQKGAECSLDTLLSIYEDNKVYDVNINEPEYNEIETVKEDDQEQNSTDVCNICWMSVNSDIENEDLVEINKEAETRQITQSIEPQVKNTDEGKRNKPLHSQDVNRELQDKRKNSLSLNDVSPEETKKKKMEDVIENRNISCGLCKAKVVTSEWDNHVRDHCFIAWEEGQKFDFNNDLLCDRLKQHLNDNGKLVCVICDKVIKRVKKFLSHVEGCILYGHVEQSDDLKNVMSRQSKHTVCGVCKTQVPKSSWIEHIAKEHNYIAWKDGDKVLDVGDEEAVKRHLNKLASDVKRFECKSCGTKRKCSDSFFKHIQKCGKLGEGMDTADNSVGAEDDTSVTCGVCQNKMSANEWQNHQFKEHKYLAWKAGEQELDLNDTEHVYSHLYNLSKDLGGLLCSKCGCRRKYVNSYLKHIEKCDGEENPNCTLDSTMNESNVSINKTLGDDVTGDLEGIVRCGVCSKEIDRKQWENHIKKEHFYKAWQEGQKPVNLDNEEDVYNHLYAMSKKYKGLVCNNCGTNRKYVKTFLQHIESCNSQDSFITDEVLKQETCKCGVCGEEVPSKMWKTHAMKTHYNVAWLDQQTPIDTNNGTAVEKCLKEYKQAYNKFVCNVCGITRVSAVGFFAHVLQCGKTEEEIDKHRGVCDICNNKYLLIYKNQHISMHRDQEYAKQRKLELQVEKEEKQKQQKHSDALPEKRQAAERARHVIEKYKKQFKHNCPTCDFGGDSEEDLKKHTCSKTKYNFSESEDSLQFSSEQESEDSDANCELLEEELEKPQKNNTKKKKHSDSNPATAFLPFPVKNTQTYLAESAEDFREKFLTSDILYPQWRTCEYEVVSDDLLTNYLPTLEESCKLQLQKDEWIALKKFESVNDHKWVSASFTGGCIQCVSWCPPHVSDAEDELGHVLSAAVHVSRDAPRLPADTCHTHHAMLQIWDYGDMRTKPKFALGIALDFGTIWAKDWCPSGTRDMLNGEPTTFKRLGLLSIACSNGSAYILSVPYPSSITDGGKKIFNLKPVAELRLTRGDRRKYQATAINWPAQKGHSTIVVGYSDGTTASYNLSCDSPLLTETEDGVKIFYPYQDERTHNTCVTAVTSFPSSGVSCPAGSSSATGGSRSVCRGVGRGSRSAVTATSACFMPHWPDLLLAGNDAIVYQAPNVLSWVGNGRRLGSQQACAGCNTCGRVALVAPPAVRLVTTHPVHNDLNKITVALLQMKPLVDKKSKQKNDDLATRLEPVTYEDAVKKYGVELKLAEDCDKSYLQQSNKPRDHYPERFPLSDVPAMAFNLSPKQHKKLAIATHSGFIFVLTV
ncbi:putative general transcription factor IIIC polypeptide 2 beta 110kDa [Danaus plexippus plexippus]|uniref:General transcription factor IIIC polypeptide 2 beta 110kDa n=1 Tax=Danaus plexippus plexippus TaxID=278856 RepID=A0A212F0T0_DANPL|nr:putative general transcription factor IIIC polypeptide 2 beta 110kDa [Danaus plexippus plexippus]